MKVAFTKSDLFKILLGANLLFLLALGAGCSKTAGPAPNTCKECKDCDPGKYCHPLSKLCLPGCCRNTDCNEPYETCNTTLYKCENTGYCTANAHCLCDGGICQYCDTANSTCVNGCSGDGDCVQDGGAYARCQNRQCVPVTCTGNQNCPNGFCCSGSSSSCLPGCRDSSECDGGICDPNTCQCNAHECTQDSHCDGDGGLPDGGVAGTYCNLTSHTCQNGCRVGGCDTGICNTVSRQCECREDTLEKGADGGVSDNNSCVTATAIQNGTFNELMLCKSGQAPYEVDYYKLTFNENKGLAIRATYNHTSDNDLQLDLFKDDCTGQPVARSQLDSGTELIELDTVPPGSYFLKVYRQLDIAGTDIPYALAVTIGEAPATCQPDTHDLIGAGNSQSEGSAIAIDFGDRNNPQTWKATALSLCGEQDGGPADEDWFKVSLYPDDRLEIALDGANQLGNIDLILHQPNGAMLAGAPSASPDETLDFTATQQGIHYLQVRGAYPNVENWPYNLTVVPHLVWVCALDNYDNRDGGNDSVETAAGLSYSRNECASNTYSLYGMTLCSSLNDFYDYYKVPVNQGDKLQIEASVPFDGGVITDPKLDVDLGIWCDGDDQNPPPYNWNVSATDQNPESLYNRATPCSALQDGWCYIRVKGSQSTHTTYDLTVNHWHRPACASPAGGAGAPARVSGVHRTGGGLRV